MSGKRNGGRVGRGREGEGGEAALESSKKIKQQAGKQAAKKQDYDIYFPRLSERVGFIASLLMNPSNFLGGAISKCALR